MTSPGPRRLRLRFLALLAFGLIAAPAAAQEPMTPAAPAAPATRPQLVFDVASGAVMHAVDAYAPWHPASLTKMMTAYVAFRKVREGRIGMQSMLRVSPLAAGQTPSKMGYRPNSEISLEAALHMLMVKSANDVSVTVAEGVGGSLEAFIGEMNRYARALGMTGSVWRNPHGLHHPEQVTTARDMALLSRALILEFPEYAGFFRNPAITAGRRTMRNFNALIGRFPGADGMKTGFVCASGFNLVASATRDGRRHVAVVFGAPSGRARSERAADLLDRSFGAGATPFGRDLPNVTALPRPLETPIAAPNLRGEVCGPNRRRGSDAEDVVEANAFAPQGLAALFSVFDGGQQGRPGEPRLPPRTQTVAMTDAAGMPVQGAVRPSLLAPMPAQVRSVVMEQTPKIGRAHV